MYVCLFFIVKSIISMFLSVVLELLVWSHVLPDHHLRDKRKPTNLAKRLDNLLVTACD